MKQELTIEIIPLEKVTAIVENKYVAYSGSDKLYIHILKPKDIVNSPVIAIDDSTDDAWTEVFKSFQDGYEWLI